MESAGHLELFEAKWTELPSPGDTTNLEHVRRAVGPENVTGGAVVCGARNGYPLESGFRVAAVEELGS